MSCFGHEEHVPAWRRDLEWGRPRHAMKRSFWRSLIAVLLGNAIYFGVMRFLPERAQHQVFRIDWGLAVDFWICLVCYGLLRFIR
jgi:hypothetical protein